LGKFKKFKVDSQGVSQICDVCGKDLRRTTSYTWLLDNQRPANRRFCSVKCLAEYEGVEEG